MRSTARRYAIALTIATPLLAGAMLIGNAQAKPAVPTGVDRVDFAAAHHPTYNHLTGGGNYGDGSNAYVREELELTDFACGNVVSYFLKFEGNGEGGAVTTTWAVDFDFATTGQPGVALVPLTDAQHLLLNTGDLRYTDTGAQAQLTFVSADPLQASPQKAVEKFFSGDTRVTFNVSGVNPGDFLVVRLDAQIHCLYPSSPTGNLLVKAASGYIGNDRINVGEQTVPLKVRGDFSIPPY